MHSIPGIKPLLSRELLGRQHELQILRTALQLAANGSPQFIVLAGEAGLGKTRLCRAFMEASQEQHTLILFGQAIRQDSALPFGLIIDALHRYFVTSAGSSLLSDPALQIAFAPLARFLPDLAPHLPERASLHHESMSTPVQQQQAMFHSVLSGLQALSRVQHSPLLLLLEDLHWADETSLDLLAFLAQRLDVNAVRAGTSPSLLIVGTYRTETMPESPALQHLLLQLRVQRRVSELSLAPLDTTEHRQLVSHILGQPIPEEFAHFLFGWDEGNPFFTEELLGAMASGGQLQLQQQGWLMPHDMKPQLPPSITAAILDRVVRLPTSDQEVLAYAAVIGRIFDFSLLAILCGLEERELVKVLRRALDVQLISEASHTQRRQVTSREEEQYHFRHALTREAIYDSMLAPERRLRHRAVAETLKRLAMGSLEGRTASMWREDMAHLLARHFWQAGLPEEARPYALQEAERASQVFAFHEERFYLDMAQASFPVDSPERLQLLQRLAMLSLLFFDIPDALRWLAEVKTGYHHIGKPQGAALVMAKLFLTSLMLSATPMPNLMNEVEALAETAFEPSSETNSDDDLLLTSSLVALYYALDCQLRRATVWIERAITLSAVLTGPQKETALLLSNIAQGWAMLHEHGTTAEIGFAKVHRVLEIARQQSLPDLILWSYSAYVSGLIAWGHTDEAEQFLEEMSAYELRSGALRQSHLFGWQHFFSGEQWEQTIEQVSSEVNRAAEQIERANLSTFAAIDVVTLAHFLLARNELTEAQRHLEAAQSTLETNNLYTYLALSWWGLARLYAMQGKLLQAEEVYEHLFERWKTTEDTCFILPITLDAIAFHADTGKLVKARQWLAELENMARTTDNPVAVAALLEGLGAVRAREGAHEQAITALRQAVGAWDQLKRRYQQALASQRLAEILLDSSGRRPVERAVRQALRAEAETLLDMALAVYERLQIPTRVTAIQALRASTHLEAQRKRRRTLKMSRPLQDLTQREMQVLAHLATGRTNREIAEALSMSVKTAGLHVSHILTKLDCATRTQAATYAVTKGWVKNEGGT